MVESIERARGTGALESGTKWTRIRDDVPRWCTGGGRSRRAFAGASGLYRWHARFDKPEAPAKGLTRPPQRSLPQCTSRLLRGYLTQVTLVGGIFSIFRPKIDASPIPMG
jgi:hypothetical protein